MIVIFIVYTLIASLYHRPPVKIGFHLSGKIMQQSSMNSVVFSSLHLTLYIMSSNDDWSRFIVVLLLYADDGRWCLFLS